MNPSVHACVLLNHPSVCYYSHHCLVLFQRFTYKVVIEIEEASGLIVECFGQPQPKKKAAAEHAAQGALWYLKQEGYLLKSE